LPLLAVLLSGHRCFCIISGLVCCCARVSPASSLYPFRSLLLHFSQPNQSERYSGGTAAHKAASYGATKILGLLIQAGADVNATERPPSRATPLHAAVRAGHLACCEVLVRAKASPYTENDNGDTPLSWAEEAERDDMVELFLTVPPPEDTPRKSSGFFGCCD
jgi:ankyrin repeat protein